MTREEAREFARIVQAYADGKPVEYTNKGKSGWCPMQTGDLHYGFDTATFDYRIKPEPREWWMVLDCDGDDCGIYKTIASAERGRNYVAESGCLIPYTIVHVREVLP